MSSIIRCMNKEVAIDNMNIHNMISRLNTRTISFRLTVLCLTAAATISICISGVLIGHISGLVREENETYLDNLLDNLTSGIDTTLYNASQVDRMLLNHVDIQDILLRSQSPDYTAQDYLHDSEKIAIIMNSLSVTEGIFYTSFYSGSGRFLFDGSSSSHPVTRDLFSEPWIQEHREAIDSRSMFLISPIHAPKGFYGNFKPFMVMRPLKDIVTKEVTAYVVVYADSSEFQSLLLKNLQGISRDIQTGPVLSIRLADTDGIIIASTNKDEYGRAIGDLAQPELLLSRQSQYSGFTIYMEPSPTYLSHALRTTLVPILGILALVGKGNSRAKQDWSLRIVRSVFRFILKLAGVTITVQGLENIPRDRAVLYVGNHRSYFDILTGYVTVPGLTGFVAKKEMVKIPLLSTWMSYVNCLFLDRVNIKEGLKTILEGIEKVKSGVSIWIFPEGTRNEGDLTDLLPFHEGSLKIAEKSGCPVIPVAITGTAEVFEDHLPLIRSSHVVIRYGEPIFLKELEPAKRKFSGAYTRDVIISMLNEMEKEKNN